jgi:hypothetical protein
LRTRPIPETAETWQAGAERARQDGAEGKPDVVVGLSPAVLRTLRGIDHRLVARAAGDRISDELDPAGRCGGRGEDPAGELESQEFAISNAGFGPLDQRDGVLGVRQAGSDLVAGLPFFGCELDDDGIVDHHVVVIAVGAPLELVGEHHRG